MSYAATTASHGGKFGTMSSLMSGKLGLGQNW
jgi:hypothetical protein